MRSRRRVTVTSLLVPALAAAAVAWHRRPRAGRVRGPRPCPGRRPPGTRPAGGGAAGRDVRPGPAHGLRLERDLRRRHPTVPEGAGHGGGADRVQRGADRPAPGHRPGQGAPAAVQPRHRRRHQRPAGAAGRQRLRAVGLHLRRHAVGQDRPDPGPLQHRPRPVAPPADHPRGTADQPGPDGDGHALDRAGLDEDQRLHPRRPAGPGVRGRLRPVPGPRRGRVPRRRRPGPR